MAAWDLHFKSMESAIEDMTKVKQTIVDFLLNKSAVEKDFLNFAKSNPRERTAAGRNFREIIEFWIDMLGTGK